MTTRTDPAAAAEIEELLAAANAVATAWESLGDRGPVRTIEWRRMMRRLRHAVDATDGVVQRATTAPRPIARRDVSGGHPAPPTRPGAA